MNYYTPAIEDLYLGYEGEIKWVGEDKQWEPIVITRKSTKKNSFNLVSVMHWFDTEVGFRTPYLTKEQIEAEGW